MSSMLLQIHLACCVPLAITDLERRGGPDDSDRDATREFASDLGSKGDQILYQGKETASLVSRLVRAFAVMSYSPGGVRFGGVVWCAKHCPRGRASVGLGLCPECV